MGIKLIPPTRREEIVLKNGDPTLRMANFMEDLASTIADLPDIIPDIVDITGSSSIIENRDKINEILAAMRTVGLMI